MARYGDWPIGQVVYSTDYGYRPLLATYYGQSQSLDVLRRQLDALEVRTAELMERIQALVDYLAEERVKKAEMELGAKKKRTKAAGKAAAAKKQEKRKLKTSSVTKGKKR